MERTVLFLLLLRWPESKQFLLSWKTRKYFKLACRAACSPKMEFPGPGRHVCTGVRHFRCGTPNHVHTHFRVLQFVRSSFLQFYRREYIVVVQAVPIPDMRL